MGGWFVLSAVFMVAVFGLFFTFTERRTWPEQRTELSATDMRLLPRVSTLWCEALALYSDHPFVAYQVNQTPSINPSQLNRQKVAFNIRLNGGRFGSSIKLKYYLLPSSVVQINACAMNPGARILVFQGVDDVQNFVQSLLEEKNESSDSSEESAEDEVIDLEKPPSLLSSYDIPAIEVSNDVFSCDGFSLLQPFRVNISAADFYTFVLVNTLDLMSNHVGLRILLDRSRYSIHKSGNAFDMCSMATSCTISLSFVSNDRALVWIPEEPDSGRSTFVVRSQCRPRLAVFAILSVFLPLLIFIVVAFVVRADRERIMRRYNRSTTNHRHRAAAPLLDNGIDARETDVNPTAVQIADEQPPSYDALYDPPPPYACVKDGPAISCKVNALNSDEHTARE